MSHQTFRLAESTVVEPLVDGWSAWSSVIAPVPASLHFAQYQSRVLQSYLASPAHHLAASRDPAMMGGPFVDVPEHRAADVREHLARSERAFAGNVQFGKDLLEFAKTLAAQADGDTLEPLYGRLPASLRGFVELVYDYQQRASLRVLEPFLYTSDYYHPELQSLRMMRLESDTGRKHFLNTPRLPEPDQIGWNVRFNDKRTAALFRLDREPQPLAAILELLDLKPSDANRLLPLLDAAPAASTPAWDDKRIRVRYFGHACLLIERRGVSILTDPVVAARPGGAGPERYSFSDLPPVIDYAIVTHNHHDHFSIETLLRLRDRIACLVVPKNHGYLYGDVSLALLARELGYRNVVELDTLEPIEVPGGEIIGAPFFGEHADVAHGKTAFVVRLGEHRMLVAADSDCLDEQVYRHLRQAIGPVHTIFLGMECVGAPASFAYGSLFPVKLNRAHDDARRQRGANAARGTQIVRALGATRAYNYAMGLEPWMEYILGLRITPESEQWRESEAFLAGCRARGLAAAERLFCRAELVLDERGEEAASAASAAAATHFAF